MNHEIFWNSYDVMRNEKGNSWLYFFICVEKRYCSNAPKIERNKKQGCSKIWTSDLLSAWPLLTKALPKIWNNFVESLPIHKRFHLALSDDKWTWINIMTWFYYKCHNQILIYSQNLEQKWNFFVKPKNLTMFSALNCDPFKCKFAP